MKTLNEALGAADPLRHEAGPTADQRARLRHTIIAAAAHAGQPSRARPGVTGPAVGDMWSFAERVGLVRPVGCSDAVGMTDGPLNQLDPVAVWIDDPGRSKVF